MTQTISNKKDLFQQQGYLVLENFIEKNICKMLINEANQLIHDFQPGDTSVIFNTRDQQHAKQDYFMNSGGNISFFFEDGAIDGNGKLIKDKMLSINKIGHALHDLNPVFNCFSRQHKLAMLAQELGIPDPLLLQSMYICKQPHIGDEVTCHQDSTYLYMPEFPVVGFWFALEDATIENGCLWAIPGSNHPLKSQFFREADNQTRVETYDDTAWNLDQMIPLEVKAGSLIVLHGLLPHMSKRNMSPKSRHAYALHVISGNYPYAKTNWLQRAAHMPLRGFLG